MLAGFASGKSGAIVGEHSFPISEFSDQFLFPDARGNWPAVSDTHQAGLLFVTFEGFPSASRRQGTERDDRLQTATQ
jgi:hypothetical protein